MLEKTRKKIQRKIRIRTKVYGTSIRPRLAIFVSNKHIVAQMIDDQAGKTLGYVTDQVITEKKNKSEKAHIIGLKISEIAKKKKISEVVFDRGGKLYHGRVKALADGAREGGLKF